MARMIKTQVTKHQRGFFGRLWQIAFWLFQLAMVGLVAANVSAVGDVSADCVQKAGEAAQASACQAGAVIGGGILAVGGWFVWLLGTLIIGLLMFATRGKLVTYEVRP